MQCLDLSLVACQSRCCVFFDAVRGDAGDAGRPTCPHTGFATQVSLFLDTEFGMEFVMEAAAAEHGKWRSHAPTHHSLTRSCPQTPMHAGVDVADDCRVGRQEAEDAACASVCRSPAVHYAMLHAGAVAPPSLPLSPLSPLVPEHFASSCAIVGLLLCGVGAAELEAHHVPEALADSSRRVALVPVDALMPLHAPAAPDTR